MDEAQDVQESSIPYRKIYPFIGGMFAGIAFRLIFSGGPGQLFTPMMGSFVYLVPLVVGAVTVYIAETSKRRTWGYYIVSSIFANTLFIIGTLLILIEGIICAIVIVPLFSIVGVMGGLLMGLVCRVTNWPKHTLYSLTLLPVLLGGIEPGLQIPVHYEEIERSILINASPARIWYEINNTQDIKIEEVKDMWVYKIGVPEPISGNTMDTAEGKIRKIRMGKNIYFDQIITDWEENKYINFGYRFYEDSFPPNALDDHVMIGGHYFDIEKTSYVLKPVGNKTMLTINMKYRISTQFNWYANSIAHLLIGNFEEEILEFYGRRARLNDRNI